MKNKNSISNSPSGIIIADNISLSLPKRKSFTDLIPLIFIAFLGCIGTVNSFVSMFDIDISFWSVNFFTVFFFLLFSAIFANPKSISVPVIPALLVYEYLLYRKWDNYLNGFMLVCNQVYQVIYPDRGNYFKIDMSEITPDSDIKLFFLFSVFLLTAIICCLSVVWPNFYLGFTFTFPFVEIGLYHGKTPHLIYALILMVYWASLLAVHHSGYYRSAKRSKTGFIRKRNTFFSKPSVRCHSAGQSGLIMMAISAAVIAVSFITINLSGYNRPQKINTIRSNVKTAVSEFNIDDISGSLERLSASFGISAFKSYDHRLGNFDSISYKGNTDLTIIADRTAVPQDNIYLKGYVGTIYDGKSWSTFSDEINDGAKDIFEKYRPLSRLYDWYGREIEESQTVNNMSMVIKPSVFNQKYMFTPYNSLARLPQDQIKYINDTRIDTSSKKSYSFEVSPYQDFTDLLTVSEDNSSDEYHDFVYRNYLDVPNNDDIHRLYDIFIKNNRRDSALEQLRYIKNTLSENAQYTLSPGKTPPESDFVSYFLLKNHKGYCVHFATAGILLARMSGIPARYADGYVLLQSDFNMNNYQNGKYRIEIQDKRAHAWAEIYTDQYGWIPYEFTPSSAAALVQDNERVTPASTAGQTRSTSLTTIRTTVSSSRLTYKTTQPTNNKGNTDRSLKDNVKKIVSGLSPEAKLSITGAAMLILALCIILIIHSIVIKKRRKSFSTDNNSKNTINAYRYIIKLLEYCDIKNQNMQYLEFAEFAENNEKRIFKSGTFREVTEIALQAGLSGKEISHELAEKIIIFSQRTSLSIFRKQNAFQKIYMKFIRNLC